MRSSRAALPLTLVALLAAGALAGVAAGAPAPAADPTGALAVTPAFAQANGSLASSNVTITIRLQPDGDARFTVSKAFALEGDTDRAAFRQLAEDFKQRRTKFDLGIDTFRNASALASDATGREMGIPADSVERTSSLGNDTGVLRLSFTWRNFAASTGKFYRVGDAFNTTHGTWLPQLREDQTLVIRPPPNYGVYSVPPVRVTNNTHYVEGPRSFEPGFLSFTWEREATPSPPVTTTTPGPDGSPMTLAMIGVFLVGIGVVALGAYAFSRRESWEPWPDDGEPDVGAGTGTGNTGAGAAGAQATESDGEDTDEEEVDLGLLSDEERVEHLLERNGGRMKQATIVKETGWSNAKVSQLLSSMADDGRVQKLRIGRENLIALPEEDIGDFE